MPWDGSSLPNAPLVRLLEADRGLTRARRSRGGLHPDRGPSDEVTARRVAQARESIVVLDLLANVLGDGEKWVQNTYHDSQGRHCLVGGLQYIRTLRDAGDHAGRFLSQAIAKVGGKREPIIDFNDSRTSYADIRAVIARARGLAQKAVDSGGQGFQTKGAQSRTSELFDRTFAATDASGCKVTVADPVPAGARSKQLTDAYRQPANAGADHDAGGEVLVLA